MSKNTPSKATIVLLATVVASFGSTAVAKIGGSVQSFQARNGRIFTFKSRSIKDDKIYYVYSLNSHPAQQHSSPGFAGGITLTVDQNKIAGESFILRLGADQDVGKVLAAALCMDLTYEAIGKPAPVTPSLRAKEFTAYSNAITRGLSGLPQVIRYKGYPMRVTISRTDQGELLLAIIPNPVPAKTSPAQ
ncbi:MAG: hypothetical protein C5B53_09465 [Candidatus Melainabacteria bacterium]|nr:MAG: hypothetical protein C5B53_09465 [Candidatus Melainabacteria bacterium]